MPNWWGNPVPKRYSLFPFLWLVYLIYPVITLAQRPVSMMLTGYILIGVFAISYLRSFWSSQWRLLLAIINMLIAGYFCITFDDPGFLTMNFFTTAMLSMIPSTRQFWTGIGTLLTISILTLWISGSHTSMSAWVNIAPPLIVLFVFPFILRMMQNARSLKTELNLAQDEIARLSKIEERQRIARDLHDTLGHTLSLITLKSELAEKLIPKKPELAVQEVKDIQATSRAALKQVRELVSGMNALSVQDELTNTSSILEAAGIRLELSALPQPLSASPLVQNILGLILREAVNNVVKHSGADKCTISLNENNLEFVLSIRDNGAGISPGVQASPGPSSGRGLLGMKERLELIQGTLSYSSVPGDGTTLCVRIPKVVKNQQSRGVS
ncbi:sensor histidine kinase [Paenibacillus sp. J22TS3]|uniref:sensor histidine kinase n=1 Tax=Paenibacillus sp. J22TS3 TaxID=2807192 RepID=UPI001B01A104|nr:sensor histidine kinase [Paenibacillus sp. J22TS3]GIP24456.1 sensor histidine kinase [Paenibacillus sp. J22TS3]